MTKIAFCLVAALLMLSGDVDVLAGEGSIRIRQGSDLKRVKPIPSRVIVANTSIGFA